jgi:hypothetical protein
MQLRETTNKSAEGKARQSKVEKHNQKAPLSVRKRIKVRLEVGKKGKLTDITKQDKKEILQILLVLAEQRAICTFRALCLASQASSFESA